MLRHVRYGHEVTGGEWDESTQRWEVRTTAGTFDAQFVISGMGPLSNPIPPDIPGLATFTGHCFHSARWDHDHDLTGKRVAVIGTGSSAAQFVPEIQPKVGPAARVPAHPGMDVPPDEPAHHRRRAGGLPAVPGRRSGRCGPGSTSTGRWSDSWCSIPA